MSKFKAGTYYIGDLCYLLEDKDYDEIVCTFKYDGGDKHTVNDITFAWGSTTHGDGCYYDNKGFSNYYVDAGLIGIVLLDGSEELYKAAMEVYNEKYANVVVFTKDFEVEMDNGFFRFGDIVIDTDSYDDEDCWE